MSDYPIRTLTELMEDLDVKDVPALLSFEAASFSFNLFVAAEENRINDRYWKKMGYPGCPYHVLAESR